MALFCRYTDNLLHFHHSIDTHPKDEDFTMHVHEQYEIFYFISGEASYLVEGTEYKLHPGDLLIMRDTESHKIKILADKPYERYALHFSPETLDPIDPHRKLCEPFTSHPLGQNNLYRAGVFKGRQPLELLESMCVSTDSAQEHRLEILVHLYPLLDTIRHAYQYQQKELEATGHNPAEEIVGYINRHLFDDLSLQILANHFFLSTSQLNRLFRQATGSSVWEYITIKRLMAARGKIKTGTPVITACQECGFHDYSSFYRAYLRRFGNSPKSDATRVDR